MKLKKANIVVQPFSLHHIIVSFKFWMHEKKEEILKIWEMIYSISNVRFYSNKSFIGVLLPRWAAAAAEPKSLYYDYVAG